MKKFSGFEETKVYTERETLPRGAYILRVLNTEEVTYSWGSVLRFDFDIDQGEHQGFYKRDYNNQFQEDKKWKGTFRLPIPKDDGSERDAWTKSRFKTVMKAFEDSNPGYVWDWNENGLKNKVIGGLFNLKEWEFNGNTGWYTQCKKLVPVSLITENKFTIPDDEPLKKEEPKTDSDGFMNVVDSDQEELPFL